MPSLIICFQCQAPKLQLCWIIIALALTSLSCASAFLTIPDGKGRRITSHFKSGSLTSLMTSNKCHYHSKIVKLDALTERQMQFWEDVEKGLDPIEQYYMDAKGENISRVREFARRAQGLTPVPQPLAPGHQPSEEHIDGLTARTFWDLNPANEELFPWALKLEQKSGIIQAELEEKLAKGQKLFVGDSAWQSQIMGGGWSAFRLQRLGVWNVENCEEFPKTYELLRSLNIPLAVRGVCFARQGCQSGVGSHSDGRNFILTAHLGLKIPNGCWIKVGGEEREWQEGKLTILDTSFDHSTGNPTDDDRHVLIIDFWHPELTEAEKSALSFVYDLRNKFETGNIPFRTPEALRKKNEGLVGLWNSFTGG
mmetsp:Transcript_14000/g.20037  ORF Transcript_14000/g.20037 Transcript_14000/m.20037 type:complete len:367 (-) Transcript_14000:87-1187(-)